MHGFFAHGEGKVPRDGKETTAQRGRVTFAAAPAYTGMPALLKVFGGKALML